MPLAHSPARTLAELPPLLPPPSYPPPVPPVAELATIAVPLPTYPAARIPALLADGMRNRKEMATGTHTTLRSIDEC